MDRRTFLTLAGAVPALNAAQRRTEVTIRGEQFLLNGQPTYPGRSYRTSDRAMKIEGLLMNVRMVNAVFMLRAVWAELILRRPLLIYEKGH